MALYLVTSPAGAGKTQYVIEQIQTLCAAKPLPRILILLPTRAQTSAFRERLGKLPRPVFGVTLADFHALYHSILDSAEALPRWMPEAARYRVLRALLQKLVCANELAYLAPIADKPGLINVVAEIIAELKEGGVPPERLSELATTPRVRDLARIYAAYQEFLRAHKLADNQGLGWLARAALAAHPQLYADYDYVAADGFDELNFTQLQILNSLAARLTRLDVTLTFDPNRRAHARFAETFARLNAPANALEKFAPPRAAPLEHLEHFLFEPNAPQKSADDHITITAAPDRVREVRAMARRVKQLLLDNVPPAQIGVLFRALSPYADIARQVFDEYGIPYRILRELPLASNPLVAALLNLAALSARDFPWRETFDALRSPYFTWRALDEQAKAEIARVARDALVLRGRDAWLAAFAKPLAAVDRDKFKTRWVDEASATEIAARRAQIEDFFTRVTPPARAPLAEYVTFLQNLIGPDPRAQVWLREHSASEVAADTTSLRVIENARNDAAELAARDLAALDAFNNILRGMLQAAELLQETESAWVDFVADLADAVNAATYDLHPMSDGRVLLASVTQARGAPKRYIFLGGLVESEFPRRAPQDPLLTVAERARLRAADIPLRDLQARDEATLFYEAVSLARERLELYYPYLDDDGNPQYPSPYLELTQQLLPDVKTRRLRVNASPEIETAASESELALALTFAPDAPRAQAIERALWQTSRAWRHSRAALAIEARRESLAACDEYSGVMRDENLKRGFAQQFAPTYAWSATQLNEWGACGFRFFARRVLNLREWAEPLEGMERTQLGAVFHRILQNAFETYAAQNFSVTSANLERARVILRECAARVLEDAPRRFAFRATAWWEQERQEITRRLEQFLRDEAERNDKNPTQPFSIEMPFDARVRLDDEWLRLRGVFDRVDRAADGYVLIDYKTGTTKISKHDVREGWHLQLPVYFFAAEAMGYAIADAFFLHIGDGKASRALPPEERAELLSLARAHILNYVAMARRGEFAVKPTRKNDAVCLTYCEFAALCRVGRWSARKGIELGDKAAAYGE